ncbi:hypothetical protein SDC9_203430 [bioreactor metagenome]|uniref:Uncharacterized protein n=1 Tax=bioreactor metagenome TaxID=1076179 RepID=A0A645IX48_9ZZZZ
MAGYALFGKRTFDYVLRGNAGVVRAGQPEHLVSLHPLRAAENVLQRVVERVSDVKRTRHVGRRYDD